MFAPIHLKGGAFIDGDEESNRCVGIQNLSGSGWYNYFLEKAHRVLDVNTCNPIHLGKIVEVEPDDIENNLAIGCTTLNNYWYDYVEDRAKNDLKMGEKGTPWEPPEAYSILYLKGGGEGPYERFTQTDVEQGRIVDVMTLQHGYFMDLLTGCAMTHLYMGPEATRRFQIKNLGDHTEHYDAVSNSSLVGIVVIQTELPQIYKNVGKKVLKGLLKKVAIKAIKYGAGLIIMSLLGARKKLQEPEALEFSMDWHTFEYDNIWGVGTQTQNLDMNNNLIEKVGYPSGGAQDSGDLATKSYVDNHPAKLKAKIAKLTERVSILEQK